MWIWAAILFSIAVVVYGMSISHSVKVSSGAGCSSCPKKGNISE
jgi:hypothetical protein